MYGRSLFSRAASFNISRTRGCFITFPNTEKRVENSTRSGVFLTNFKGVWKCDETLSELWDIHAFFSVEAKTTRENGETKLLNFFYAI